MEASDSTHNESQARGHSDCLAAVAEQRRIVAKVDELTALCDRLEASMTETADVHRRLLDALLAEALAPADRTEMLLTTVDRAVTISFGM